MFLLLWLYWYHSLMILFLLLQSLLNLLRGILSLFILPKYEHCSVFVSISLVSHIFTRFSHPLPELSVILIYKSLPLVLACLLIWTRGFCSLLEILTWVSNGPLKFKRSKRELVIIHYKPIFFHYGSSQMSASLTCQTRSRSLSPPPTHSHQILLILPLN